MREDRTHPRRPAATRRLLLAGMVAALAGCTVQPLHQAGVAEFAVHRPLTGVVVDPVSDRVTQQVRNRLLFGLYGGDQADPDPRWRATITAVPRVQDVFRTTAPDGSTNISASRLTLVGTLTLVRIADGEVIASETRAATASYDRTRQEFANLRARLEAEDRAAAELAALFRIAIATALAGR